MNHGCVFCQKLLAGAARRESLSVQQTAAKLLASSCRCAGHCRTGRCSKMGMPMNGVPLHLTVSPDEKHHQLAGILMAIVLCLPIAHARTAQPMAVGSASPERNGA